MYLLTANAEISHLSVKWSEPRIRSINFDIIKDSWLGVSHASDGFVINFNSINVICSIRPLINLYLYPFVGRYPAIKPFAVVPDSIYIWANAKPCFPVSASLVNPKGSVPPATITDGHMKHALIICRERWYHQFVGDLKDLVDLRQSCKKVVLFHFKFISFWKLAFWKM